MVTQHINKKKSKILPFYCHQRDGSDFWWGKTGSRTAGQRVGLRARSVLGSFCMKFPSQLLFFTILYHRWQLARANRVPSGVVLISIRPYVDLPINHRRIGIVPPKRQRRAESWFSAIKKEVFDRSHSAMSVPR